MPPKKKATVTSRRTSTRNVKPKTDPAPLTETNSEEPNDEIEAIDPSPRKRARTNKQEDGPNTAGTLIKDDLPSTAHDTIITAPPTIERGESSVAQTEDKPQLSIKTAEESTIVSTPGENPTAHKGESPTNEVSQKFSDVMIETPAKPLQSPTTRSSRSRQSKATNQSNSEDTIMKDASPSAETPSNRRSGRVRKAPAIYNEDEYLDSARKALEQAPPTKKAKTTGSKSSARTPSKTGVWSSHHLLTSRRSKIINAEMNMIFNENTWELFTEEEKERLLALLPPCDTEITYDEPTNPDEPKPQISTGLLFQNLQNNVFRSAFAELQEDLASGSYEPSYVKAAAEALEARLGSMSLKVDEMKNGEFEEYWGQKQAVSFGDAGGAGEITLAELCERKLIKVGDRLEYRRAFASKTKIEVEKVVLLQGISFNEDKESTSTRRRKEVCTLTFSMPSGTRKFPSQTNENKVTTGESSEKQESEDHVETSADKTVIVTGLNQLSHTILDEDGRVKASDPEKYKTYPSANAWKHFNVYRNNELIGSTFNIRQRYYEKTALNK